MGFLIGRFTVVDSVRVVEKIDVKWVEKPEVKYVIDAKLEQIPVKQALIDLGVTKTDTVYKDITVASADTSLSKDGAFIKVKYYSDPFYKFKIDYKPPPEKIVTKTVTKTITRTNWIDYGLQVTAGYGLINKKFDVTVGFGIRLAF